MDVDLVKEEGSASNMLPAADVQTMSAGSGNAMCPSLAFSIPVLCAVMVKWRCSNGIEQHAGSVPDLLCSECCV